MAVITSIATEVCEDLLAKAEVGRLGIVVNGQPEIFPISHVFDPETRCVAFPTNTGTKLRGALTWPRVAYEVDGLEPDGGWSVLVVGRAEEITDEAEIGRLSALRAAPWRSGATVRWLRIVPAQISGRRVSAA